ncbi:MAG TPA: chorismate mutase [Gemmatimonadaceae bacterium]|nr:chorismate mutase [Gemmatimonadaceae bacterium]
MDKRLCAVRGATTVESDSPEQIASATAELLSEIMSRNGLETGDVISAIFTVTPDIVSDFPARAARDLGWEDVSLLCTREIPVTGALEHCIRVLIHAESSQDRASMRHVYLRGAKTLRPDLISE